MLNRKQKLVKGGACRGSTLIELLIAMVFTSLTLVAVAISIVSSIQRTAQARYKDVATTLAQEGIEAVLRDRAEEGWYNFLNRFDAGSENSYCLDDQNNLTVCSAPSKITRLSQDFYRQITIYRSSTDELDVDSTVNWDARGGKTPLHVTLRQSLQRAY